MNALTKLRMIRDFLSQFRFNFTSEAELQAGIEQAMAGTKFQIEREYRISSSDRLDFLIDGEIVIETKIGGSAADAMRQVSRYAAYGTLTGFLLITNRATHNLPESFNGKPCLVHSLMESAF